MKNNNLKSLYKALFILAIIETLLFFFPGNILSPVVFIIVLKIISQFRYYNFEGTIPKGLKFLLIGSIIHFISFLILGYASILIAIKGFHSNAFYLLRTLENIFIILVVFSVILLSSGCIFTYKEYKNIK